MDRVRSTPHVGWTRVCCGVLLVLACLVTSAGAGASPLPSSGFGPGIEAFPTYDGQDKCSPTAKPGVLAFRSKVLTAFPDTGAGGIERACSIGGQSEHKEGRAWDWMVNASIPTQRAAAESVFAWLTSSDRFGNQHAMARRVGIMYMIFDRKIWFPGSGWRVYCMQKDFGCHVPGDRKSLRHPHTDHVHFSFTWNGAMKRTTFWRKGRSLLSDVATPAIGSGYWLLARTGGVAAVGAKHHGSALGSTTATVGMAAHPKGDGYWLVDKRGRVKAFGDSRHLGGVGNQGQRIAGIEATPSGRGYWLYSKDGRVFPFGDAPKLGQSSEHTLAGMQTTPTGLGYWLAAEGGAVLAFGDADHYGDLEGTGVPVVGIEGSPSGAYWLVTTTGSVKAFGPAQHHGEFGDGQRRVVGMAATATGEGYWLVSAKGKVRSFGDAPALGGLRSLSSMYRGSQPPPEVSPLD